MIAPFKKVVASEQRYEEHSSDGKKRQKTYSWWTVRVTTIQLECGHEKVYRGEAAPRTKARCASCTPAEVSC